MNAVAIERAQKIVEAVKADIARIEARTPSTPEGIAHKEAELSQLRDQLARREAKVAELTK